MYDEHPRAGRNMQPTSKSENYLLRIQQYPVNTTYNKELAGFEPTTFRSWGERAANSAIVTIGYQGRSLMQLEQSSYKVFSDRDIHGCSSA